MTHFIPDTDLFVEVDARPDPGLFAIPDPSVFHAEMEVTPAGAEFFRNMPNWFQSHPGWLHIGNKAFPLHALLKPPYLTPKKSA